MKVLMVLAGEFPPDERVEKEIESLQKAGFTVVLAAYTMQNKPAVELYHNYTIYRKRISQGLYKSSAAALILPFYFHFWYRFLDTILKKESFHFIHIHDLPLSKTGYQLARKYKLKLVCDQHEYYSNWIVRTRHYNTLAGRAIRIFSNWTRYERKYLQKADLVITVADSLKDIYINHVKVSPAKVITLPNTPRVSDFNLTNVDKDILEKYKNKFVLFYGGSLDELRGIDFILQGIAKLKHEIPDLLFLVAGKENRTFNLQSLIMKYQVEKEVEYAGWVPLSLLSSYVAASHVCLFVPRADNMEINNTIATKIYQYAAMGKPVIVSEARLMKEFVEANNLGISVHFGNVEEFCDSVLKLRSSPEITEHIKDKADAIAQQYSWEKTSIEFIHYYDHLKS
jgi:glycosyltransferase involved in cell wall biosynthesis